VLEFPLDSLYSGIVHHLLGLNMGAHTQTILLEDWGQWTVQPTQATSLLWSDSHGVGHVDVVWEVDIIKILQNLDDISIKMPTTNWLFKYACIIKCAYPALCSM
jgi:hypothetical protein